MGLRSALHLKIISFQIFLLFSFPGLIQSLCTGALGGEGGMWPVTCMHPLLLRRGMFSSALLPWPRFVGAGATWDLTMTIRVLPDDFILRLSHMLFCWIMKLLMPGSCLWSCLRWRRKELVSREEEAGLGDKEAAKMAFKSFYSRCFFGLLAPCFLHSLTIQ